MKNKLLISIIASLILFSFGLFSPKTTHAQLGVTVVADHNNTGTTWGTSVKYRAHPDSKSWGPITAYVTTNSFPFATMYLYSVDPLDKITWYTACVDPTIPVSGSSFMGLTTVRLNVTCKTGYARTNTTYGACESPNGLGTVPLNAVCPASNVVCVVGGIYYTSNCTNYCGGTNNCTYYKRDCGSSGCYVSSSTQYATVCNDPTGSNDGGNRCAPPPPANRTDSAFCNGTTGTDQAAGVSMDWDAIPYGTDYDVQLRKVGGGDLHEITKSGTQWSFPGGACTTGPGGCSLPYSTAYEWRVRGHTSSGHAGPTDWSNWNPRTTKDCSAKPELKITAFTFPGCEVSTTRDVPVTILNASDKGTTKDFVVRVRNGDGAGANFVVSGGLGARASRTVTVPNVPCPATANSYTARAIVDNTDVVNEDNEGNNTLDDVYNARARISGFVWVDWNENGSKDAGEDYYTGGDAKFSINAPSISWTSNFVNPDGTYSTGLLNHDTYTITLNVIPANYRMSAGSTQQVTRTLGPSTTKRFGIYPTRIDLNTHVFIDNDLNGFQDAGDANYPNGASITVTGQGAGNYTTDSNGNYTLIDLPFGNSQVTINNFPPPSGWTLSTARSRAVALPPGGTVNFGVAPPAPSCAGGVTASPVTVTPGTGVTSTLTCISPNSPSGAPLSFSWTSLGPGTTTGTTNTATWNSPATTTAQYTDQQVQICYQGTANCGYDGVRINLIQRYDISGSVYEDDNGNKKLDSGEIIYDGPITVTAAGNTSGSSIVYPSNGKYTVRDLLAGTYTIAYTNKPTGYNMTYPTSVGNPQFTVTIGTPIEGYVCNTNGHNDAVCNNGDVLDLNFGMTNKLPWFQSAGADVWFNDGINNPVPSGKLGSVLGTGGTPGVMFSGVGSYDFSPGGISNTNWIVGGLTYPTSYSPSKGVIKTSYEYVKALADQNHITPIDIASACGGNISSCTLPGGLSNGIYVANGDLTITNASYTFPANRDFVILVNGNLNLNGEIHTPVGSTLLMSAKGSINVATSVGTSTLSSTTANLEGWFSANSSFYIDGYGDCSSTDKRLNIAGSVIANATSGGGSVSHNRNLCAQNLNYPVFYVSERPDFILNAPRFLQSTNRVWQEVAP